MCTLSCVHWQLSLSFVLCPWEKPMSFYNMMNIVYSMCSVFDLVDFFLVRDLCKLAVKVHNEAVVCFLFFVKTASQIH